MIHVLKRLVKEKFSSCLSIFSTIGTSPLTIHQSSSGDQSGWGITGFGKDSQGIELNLTEPHIFKGYWWIPGTETSSRQGAASLRLITVNDNH